MRISDWSSDVCSSDLPPLRHRGLRGRRRDDCAHPHRDRAPVDPRAAGEEADRCAASDASRRLRLMEVVLALAIGVLTASGLWLVFRPRTFQVILGLSLLSYAVNLFIRSEEHTSELQSLMRKSYAVFCLKKNTH